MQFTGHKLPDFIPFVTITSSDSILAVAVALAVALAVAVPLALLCCDTEII